MFQPPIYVTKPLLPSDKILNLISDVMESGWISNMGPQHDLLTKELCEYLDVSNLELFNNGTSALTVALRSLELPAGGEVITTPFTFAATPHTISWNELKPVFADIEKDTFTLSPESIEKAITPNTCLILPVHIYGYPCDVRRIEELSKKYNLPVIYDGAHSFSTKIENKSVCDWGDMTMLSFHATKLFNTIEGGAIVYNNKDLGNKIRSLRNFGIDSSITQEKGVKTGIESKDIVPSIGLNGKLNEVQAVWGRENLKEVSNEQKRRGVVADHYKLLLKKFNFISVLKFPSHITDSRQYFPILFHENSVEKRDHLYMALQKENVFTRKYFYPLCSDFTCYSGLPSAIPSNLVNAHSVSERILCLPYYGDLLKNNMINKLCNTIERILLEAE